MSKATKIWLITAAVLTAVGMIVFTGAVAVLKFDFTKLGTEEYKTNTYEVSGAFDRISIDVDTTDISFAPSDDGACRVVCVENEKEKHSVFNNNGTLIIGIKDSRKWYEHIGISVSSPKMTVYLPENGYISLSIETDTGDIIIPKDFAFEAVEIETDTGDIKTDGITVGKVDFSADTGNIIINSLTAQGNINIETDTGKVELTDITCNDFIAESDTGDIALKKTVAKGKFHIESSTGDVRFENSDATELWVKTSTGDVRGSLLSEKVFITKTSTGYISVPKTVTGGRCEITTSTGDVKIEIE